MRQSPVDDNLVVFLGKLTDWHNLAINGFLRNREITLYSVLVIALIFCDLWICSLFTIEISDDFSEQGQFDR